MSLEELIVPASKRDKEERKRNAVHKQMESIEKAVEDGKDRVRWIFRDTCYHDLHEEMTVLFEKQGYSFDIGVFGIEVKW